MPEQCSICERKNKLHNHHLSYNPEIITKICLRCHMVIHRLAEMGQEQRNIISDWVEQYGHLWKNASEKYKKSENLRIRHKDYQAEQSFKKLNLEKMTKRINKMEKLIERNKGECDATTNLPSC